MCARGGAGLLAGAGPSSRREGAGYQSCGRVLAFYSACAAILTVSGVSPKAEKRKDEAEKRNNRPHVCAQGFNIVRRVDDPLRPVTSQTGHRVRPSSVEELVTEAGEHDVLLIGEVHDDAEAHRLESHLLKRVHEEHGNTRQIVLSLEMFERDVQVVMNEYLQGLIRETDFISDARAWGNYKDYRPLIEYAKAAQVWQPKP